VEQQVRWEDKLWRRPMTAHDAELGKTVCFGVALVVGACGVLYVISHLVVG
jgi:hypothetical protein